MKNFRTFHKITVFCKTFTESAFYQDFMKFKDMIFYRMAAADRASDWLNTLNIASGFVQKQETILRHIIKEVKTATTDCWSSVEEACKSGSELVTGLREDAEKIRFKFLDVHEALNEAEKAASDVTRKVQGFQDVIEDMGKSEVPPTAIKNYADRVFEELKVPNERMENAQQKFGKLLSETEMEMDNISSKIKSAQEDLRADMKKAEVDVNHDTALMGAGTSALTVVGAAAACFFTFSNPFGMAAAVVAGVSALGAGATAVKYSRSKDILKIDNEKQLKILENIKQEIGKEFGKVKDGHEIVKMQIHQIVAAQAVLATKLHKKVRDTPKDLLEELDDFERFFLDTDKFLHVLDHF